MVWTKIFHVYLCPFGKGKVRAKPQIFLPAWRSSPWRPYLTAIFPSVDSGPAKFSPALQMKNPLIKRFLIWHRSRIFLVSSRILLNYFSPAVIRGANNFPWFFPRIGQKVGILFPLTLSPPYGPLTTTEKNSSFYHNFDFSNSIGMGVVGVHRGKVRKAGRTAS